MPSDPKPSKQKPDPPSEVVHEPDEQKKPEEKIEEDGEPFDGNFA